METPVPVPPTPHYPNAVKPLLFCWQRTLPMVLDDGLSYIERLNKMNYLLNEMTKSLNMFGEDMKAWADYIEQLYEILKQFMESGFDDYYKQQVIEWIDQHLTWLFTTVARQVYFGLTLEGYFAAYIPQGWSDIVFDTGAVYTLDTYGRLILRWDADSPYTVDQTRETVRS